MKPLTRRAALQLAGQSALAAAFLPTLAGAVETPFLTAPHGVVVGEPLAAVAGEKILREGGNAVDAVITAALTACLSSPGSCGVGGYGGHMVIAFAKSKRVVSIDYNSTAPAAARPDMFPLDEKGQVKGKINVHGWLAAGVPGTLAGMQLALDRFGTIPLRRALQPAIALAEDGVVLAPNQQFILPNNPSKDDPSPNAAAQSGGKQTNPRVAAMLRALAQDNSVAAFYDGKFARTIAQAFHAHGGLVTTKDLAAYRAHVVEPLAWSWGELTLHTAPLTAGGLTMLEALHALGKLAWPKLSDPLARLHAKLEALRIAWINRLQLCGDPKKASVPVATLLSTGHAHASAAKIRTALEQQQPVPLPKLAQNDGGTVNLSAVDREGNMVALTLTHGGSYGARVQVEELGFYLGHGMSRFDPQPGHPNCPEPGKRPLHNMCPTVVTRGGRPVMAVGGAGGTRIPNGVFEVLLRYVGEGLSLRDAMSVPRLHTTGGLDVFLGQGFSEAETQHLRKLGYTLKDLPSAYLSGVTFDPVSGPAGFARGWV